MCNTIKFKVVESPIRTYRRRCCDCGKFFSSTIDPNDSDMARGEHVCNVCAENYDSDCDCLCCYWTF